MTEARTLFVAFDGRQVAVSSDTPEVLAAFERSFRRMLRPEAGRLVARLKVGRVPEGYVLRCDQDWVKSESLDGVLFYLSHEVVLRLIGARPDFLWLHAGAAAFRDRAVLVCGLSGRGKSTIVAALCDLGWHFLSDDVTPLDPLSGQIIPFPQTPMYRPHPGEEIPSDRLHELSKVEAAINPEGWCREAVPVAALIFPTYDPRQTAALTGCSPAVAAGELLQNCLNFAAHRETAFHQLCHLVKALPTLRLAFSSGAEAARLLAQTLISNSEERPLKSTG
jgi:hypothetical protein